MTLATDSRDNEERGNAKEGEHTISHPHTKRLPSNPLKMKNRVIMVGVG